MRGSGAGGRLCCECGSVPAEGRHGARRSIFPRDVTNNSNDAPGGPECEKARRGGCHAGHLVCGLPAERGLGHRHQQNPLEPVRGVACEWGEPLCSWHPAARGTTPLQPKQGSALLPMEMVKTIPSSSIARHKNRQTVEESSAAHPGSCLYPPHEFSMFRCCPKGTASEPFESLTFHCCLFDTIIFRHMSLKTYQHLK